MTNSDNETVSKVLCSSINNARRSTVNGMEAFDGISSGRLRNIIPIETYTCSMITKQILEMWNDNDDFLLLQDITDHLNCVRVFGFFFSIFTFQIELFNHFRSLFSARLLPRAHRYLKFTSFTFETIEITDSNPSSSLISMA